MNIVSVFFALLPVLVVLVLLIWKRMEADTAEVIGGLASVISPAKLHNVSAAIDRIGEEAGCCVSPSSFR